MSDRDDPRAGWTPRHAARRRPTPTRRAWVSGAAVVVAVAAVIAAVGILRTSPERTVPGTERCTGADRTLVETPRGSSSSQFSPQPIDDSTFDASESIWRPDLSTYPINIDTHAERICWLGGEVYGSIPESMTWEDAHDLNQPCIRVVATEWVVIDGVRCDNTDDGIRPRETDTGAQNLTMTIRNTYLTRIRDDCLENDGVIGGLLEDNLWDGCNTGISARPSDDQGAFDQPEDETLILDRMLIGLRLSPHEEGGLGENALFKWSDSANRLVIRCSIFKVNAVSLNGPEAMEVPGTVDDRACPNQPTTLVWLGEGEYPGSLPDGIVVTSDESVWDEAVVDWKCRHGHDAAGCRQSPSG